jgi:GH15 family glucan-1,4-alpha-glucosidase
MSRPVILGNGQLTVGLNENGLVHDFYYPYVGLDNLTTARSNDHKIGVWVDGKFSWVGSDDWIITTNFETNALVSIIQMHNKDLQVSLLLQDFVDHEYNVFCRKITITNESDSPRDIRVFMHQVFEISRRGRADTALFVPEENYILDYKGRYSLLIYGQSTDGTIFDQFAIGNYGIEGKEGTFRDAEDGELTGNPVEHGGVDSVLRFPCSLGANCSTTLDYWIITADSQYSAEQIHHIIIDDGLEKRLANTRAFWQEWLSPAVKAVESADNKYIDATKKSLMVIKAHIDKRGGIIASCDSSIYNYGRDYYSYVWPRDGAFAIWPLIRLGYQEEPKKFFEFCRDILNKDGYLMHKYQPDRAIGSTWHPLVHGRHAELAIQEDETAIVIYMLGEYFSRTNDTDFVYSLYATLVQPSANFMTRFIDDDTELPHASYDLWEQKFLTNTYTVFIVYQALLFAADFADKFEYPDDAVNWRDTAATIASKIDVLFDKERGMYYKGYLLQDDHSLQFDNTLDVSSLYGPMMFGGNEFDSTHLTSTAALIETILLDKSPSGGAPRYEHDDYFMSNPPYLGNPWIITTLWMAQYYIRRRQPDRAKHYIDWVLNHALQSGVLSEQVNPNDGAPVSVAPLVWSHTETVNTILDLLQLLNKAKAESNGA